MDLKIDDLLEKVSTCRIDIRHMVNHTPLPIAKRQQASIGLGVRSAERPQGAWAIEEGLC